jgi:hypothetical protein
LANGDGKTLRLAYVGNTVVLAMTYSTAIAATDDFFEALRDDGKAALQEAENTGKQAGLRSESGLLETTIDNTDELLVKQAMDWPADNHRDGHTWTPGGSVDWFLLHRRVWSASHVGSRFVGAHVIQALMTLSAGCFAIR